MALKSNGGGLHVDFQARVTPTQLEMFAGLDYGAETQVLIQVAQIRDAGNWWAGDGLMHMEAKHGEMYAQAATETGISEDTLTILKHVALKVPPENRRKELSWSHHRLVAKLDSDDQKKWLQGAIDKHWSVRELNAHLNPEKDASDNEGEESAGKDKHCECCGAESAPMRVCGKCASVASRAIETVGVRGAIQLLGKRPSKPQIEMLRWAFEHVKEPNFFKDETEQTEWAARYDAMKNVVERQAESKARRKIPNDDTRPIKV